MCNFQVSPSWIIHRCLVLQELLLANIGALDDLEDDEADDSQGQPVAGPLPELSANQEAAAAAKTDDTTAKKTVSFTDVTHSIAGDNAALPLSSDGKFVLLETSQSRESLKSRDEPEVDDDDEEEPESEA